MKIEARLLDGPAAGDMFGLNQFRPDMEIYVAGRPTWDWNSSADTPTLATKTKHHYRAEYVIVQYRHVGGSAA